mmetsp:Transcript_3343/g.7723  ORF Transcript_3343/g.7723 Transcript_3343/m.7723 type:complete len:495 (+) Transcript_3343:180-1664(+)
MPPKKKKAGGKKTKKSVKVSDFTDADLECFIKNYTNFSKAAGLPVYGPIVKCLTEHKQEFDGGGNENLATRQFFLSPLMKDGRMVNPDEPRLGPGGCRAMATAILATGPGMAKALPTDPGGPFKALRSLRIWHNRIGDDGAAALAEVLRLGGSEVKLVYLELWHNLIGPRGCRALGDSLAGPSPLNRGGGNRSLEGFKLDFNPIGSAGLTNLARGLRSNTFLKNLSLSHCQIGPEGCAALAAALCFPGGKLSVLNLSGNHLGDAGLEALCGAPPLTLGGGLAGNKSLTVLNLADNQLGTHPRRSAAAFASLASCVRAHPLLSVLNLDWNRLCLEAGEALLPGLMDPDRPGRHNPRLKEVRIDCQLGFPEDLFALLNFKGGSTSKKGGKKGGSSKKRKGASRVDPAVSNGDGQVLSLAESALAAIEKGVDPAPRASQQSGASASGPQVQSSGAASSGEHGSVGEVRPEIAVGRVISTSSRSSRTSSKQSFSGSDD